jgi:glycosyltransferase involved in cell wall biosynthesis
MSLAVSVVIPSRDRPAGVARLLEALRHQTIGIHRFEVIVVDDGSELPSSPEPEGLRLRLIRHERSRGPGAARNSGWRAAHAPLVAFIDDDCVPAEGWLEGLLAAADGDQLVVQGSVRPKAERRAPLSHTIEVGGISPLFVSANIAYPRALLEHLDGFDERFRRAGEDAELGARAMQAGAGARFAPDALVYHDVRDLSVVEHIRHTLKWMDAVGVLRLHPELRSLLMLRVFWKPTHPWLIGAMVALGARRKGLAAIALVPYLLRYLSIYEGDLQLLAPALPKHLVIDASEVATAIAGSVRHRTLML